VVEERTVGPDLGADSIRKGVIAMAVGTLALVVFIIATYGRLGVYACVALVMNMLMILGVMATIGATLTLPGIAGFVLTIGAAVDANVLINERIREERHRGRRVVAAVETGYKEASRAIFDANVTNVIAAVLMASFGTGPVKGFAVVLMIGIATSVHLDVAYPHVGGAVAASRPPHRPAFVRGSADHETPEARSRQHQHPLPQVARAVLSGQPAADGGLARPRVHQGSQPGRRFRRRPDDPRDVRAQRRGPVADLRSEVAKLGYGEPIIQRYGKPNEISIRMKLPENAEHDAAQSDKMARTITADIKSHHADARIDGVDSVSGKVSKELGWDAFKALALPRWPWPPISGCGLNGSSASARCSAWCTTWCSRWACSR
jgi:preprotein translocase subunit SecF